MLKLAFAFVALSGLADPAWADGPIHPTILLRPLPRPISVKPAYRNLVFRGLARQDNYNAAQFLLNPSVREDFEVQALSPAAQRAFQSLRADVKAHQEGFDPQNVKNLVTMLGSEPSSFDIESLITMIMMELASDASADLKAMLEAMKSANAAKQAAREHQSALQGLAASCRQNPNLCRVITAAELEQDIAKATASLDSLSEMSETQQLRLQMVEEQRSKAMETLSNVLKKISDTAQAIVQNLK